MICLYSLAKKKFLEKKMLLFTEFFEIIIKFHKLKKCDFYAFIGNNLL